MTSFAFILGVLPLVIATGAGRGVATRARHHGVRRHDRGDVARHLHRAGALRRDSAARRAWRDAQREQRGAGGAAGGGDGETRRSDRGRGGPGRGRARWARTTRRPAVAMPAGLSRRRAGGGAAESAVAGRHAVVRASSRTTRCTALVRTALERNFDVRIAAERVSPGARALQHRPVEQFPTVDADGRRLTNRRLRDRVGRPAARRRPCRSTTSQADFAVAWELDVWGRLRRHERGRRGPSTSPPRRRGAAVVDHAGRPTSPTAYLPLRSLDRAARDRPAHPRRRRRRLAPHRAAPRPRRGDRARRPPGGAAALTADRADRQHRARHRPDRERAEPAARRDAGRRSPAAARSTRSQAPPAHAGRLALVAAGAAPGHPAGGADG